MTFFFWSLASVLNLVLAILVFCMMVSGASAYRAMGIRWMAKRDERGSWAPKIIMWIVLLMFVYFAACALSLAIDKPLPYAKSVMSVLTFIYLLRASVLIFDKYINPPLPTFVLMASWGALAIGLVQLLALIASSL